MINTDGATIVINKSDQNACDHAGEHAILSSSNLNENKLTANSRCIPQNEGKAK